MISFKEYLIESRSAPLYHGTGLDSAQNILKTNKFFASGDAFGDAFGDEGKGVSLTRHLRTAIRFVKGNTLGAVDDHNLIVFELDQQKLSQNYKIRPYNYFSMDNVTRYPDDKHTYNEFEERVVGPIKNADRYITKVIVLVKPGKKMPGNLILNHPKLFYNGKFVNK